MTARILIFVIRIYQQTISRMLGPCCRFHPSCSQYAVEAIRTHGALRGLNLAARRLLRCHPFHEGGVDPVPVRLCGTQHHEAPLVSKRSHG